MSFFTKPNNEVKQKLITHDMIVGNTNHFMSKQRTNDEENYYNKVMDNIAVENIKSMVTESFDMALHKPKSKTMVSYTQGRIQADNDPICTDHEYREKMGLNQRCHLLHAFNELGATLANIEAGMAIPVKYTKEIDQKGGTCKIFRELDLNKAAQLIENHKKL